MEIRVHPLLLSTNLSVPVRTSTYRNVPVRTLLYYVPVRTLGIFSWWYIPVRTGTPLAGKPFAAVAKAETAAETEPQYF